MKPFLTLLGVLTATLAIAQVTDPMRPPGALSAPDAAGLAGIPVAEGVQAVFLRHGAKPAALINGEYVVQGGKLGDRRVIRITETEVVLRGADGHRETMRVISGAEKTAVVRKAAARKKPGSSGAASAQDDGATTR